MPCPAVYLSILSTPPARSEGAEAVAALLVAAAPESLLLGLLLATLFALIVALDGRIRADILQGRRLYEESACAHKDRHYTCARQLFPTNTDSPNHILLCYADF
jgi:hypothetical protein